RTLSTSKAAVVIGRTASDVLLSVLSIAIVSIAGLIGGRRIRRPLLHAVLVCVLLLVFAYSFSWVMAYVGLLVPSVEVINNASFMVIMPMTFVSNAFVPLEQFPSWLQPVVEWHPVSTLIQAVRELFGNVPEGLAVV